LKSGGIFSTTGAFRFGQHDDQETRAILPFLLPDLGATSNPFTDVDLTLTIFQRDNTGSGAISQHGDLYGLDRISSSSTILSSDFGATASLVQSSFLTPETPIYTKTTTASGSTALTTFLNDQYDSGAGIGQYVFLRLQKNDSVGSVAKYGAYFIHSGDEADDSLKPVLSATTIPEPGSLVLLLLGSLAIVFRRKRVAE
jgi:hypothetical protein